jgi:phage shock protein PspC (stress-responsive transcriptional regulator)
METTETIRETRRLTRPRDGRWLGGVAAGLGAYFDLSPTIYRIAFVALSLAGGTGILLYIAAWLVIPEEGHADSIAATALKRERDRPGRAIGLALLAFVGILVLGEASFWPDPGNVWLAVALAGAALVWWQVGGRAAAAPTTEAAPGGTTPPAPAAATRVRRASIFPIAAGALLIAVGAIALLDAGGVWNADWRFVLGGMVVALGGLVAAGAATDRSVGGVIGIGVLLALALALTLAVRVPLFAGVGDRVEHPTTIEALDSSYRFGIGDFNLNLADLPLASGETHVKTTLGIGDMTVHVPYGVAVDVDARASGGQIVIFGHIDDGTSVHSRVHDSGTMPGRVLSLDARVGFGRLTVVRG